MADKDVAELVTLESRGTALSNDQADDRLDSITIWLRLFYAVPLIN